VRIAALAAATAIVARQPGQTTRAHVLAAAERLEGWLRVRERRRQSWDILKSPTVTPTRAGWERPPDC